MEENILGYEKIGKLVRKFSVPCVISMVVAALYNIVDQIFIGWSEAGAYGNAATNIVYTQHCVYAPGGSYRGHRRRRRRIFVRPYGAEEAYKIKRKKAERKKRSAFYS